MSDGRRRGLHGEIVEILGARIVTGQIAEGATLSISALVEELGISLTVVREALKVLAAKGLVDARQKRGTFVRPRSGWHLLDADVLRWRFSGAVDERFLEQLHEVREIIEPAVAKLAAVRRTADDLDALDAALDAMATAGEADAAVAADTSFHRILLGASHNELLEQLEVVLGPGLASRDRFVHGTRDHLDAVPSHAAVVDALRRGDAGAAESAVHQLLHKAGADAREAAKKGEK